MQMEPSTLISCREDISSLSLDQPLGSKYHDLRCQFSAVRKIRGDGNCFFRALCFAYMESMLHTDRALERFKDKLIKSEEDFSSAGFEESSFKDHLNTFIYVVEQCQTDGQEQQRLLQLLNDPSVSNSVVQYLRLLTSAHLQIHADFFTHFVEAPNLKVYCKQEVETMAMECDHVDILALAQALGVGIHIVSMEGDGQELVHHIIPEEAEPSLHLIHHTSHYDILYPRAEA